MSSCSTPQEESPSVLLLCLDGVHPGLVDELRAEGKLPHLDRLIRQGSSGPLRSLQSHRVSETPPSFGFWSPVLWTSIATGQVPEKHGVLDFLLPAPGTAFAWAGHSAPQEISSVRFPELAGVGPWTLKLRIRAYEGALPQTVGLTLNQTQLLSQEIVSEWQEISVPFEPPSLQPVWNLLHFRFSRHSQPSSQGESGDSRFLAAAVGDLQIQDASGQVVHQMNPVLDRFAFLQGFYPPEGRPLVAGSGHWKAPALWDLLALSGQASRIIGYWATWPAKEMLGTLVSSHMGLRGKRLQRELDGLTWPPDLAGELLSLAPSDPELEVLLRKIFSPECSPARPDKMQAFRDVLWQDLFYQRIAKKLFHGPPVALSVLYLESIDVASHHFLPLRNPKFPLPDGCQESDRKVVEWVYRQVDQWIGELLPLFGEQTHILVVSDHGLVAQGNVGTHSPEGILIAAGPGIRKMGKLQGAGILAIAPTILQLLGEAIPLNLDGHALVQLFEPAWLESFPLRFRPAEVWKSAREPNQDFGEDSEEFIERLQGIGYLDSP